MGFFGDLFHNPLKTLGHAAGDVAKVAAPFASFIPGAGAVMPWLNMASSFGGGNGGGVWGSHGVLPSGGYGDLVSDGGGFTGNGGGGFGGYGGGGMNPDVSALFRTPYGQNMLYGNPLDMGGSGYQSGLDTAGQLRGAGGDMLNKGMNGLPQFGTGQMGALDNMGGIMDQEAKLNGVASPFGHFGGTTDPYSMDPATQQAFNALDDTINQSRDSQIADMRNHMMSNGITDPRTLAAMEAQIHASHDNMANTTRGNMMQQSYNNRMNVMNSFMPAMNNLYGAQFGQQQSNLAHGGQFLEGAGGLYGQGTNNAIHMNDVRDTSLGHLFGLGLGAHGFGGYGGQGNYGLPHLGPQGGGTTSGNSGLPQTYGPSDYSYNPGAFNSPANDYLGVDNPWGQPSSGGYGFPSQESTGGGFGPGDYNWMQGINF